MAFFSKLRTLNCANSTEEYLLLMKFLQLFIFFFLFFSASVFSQKIIKHNVKSGESIYALAKKYDVSEKEIYELNPKLKGAVLGLKTEVKIPNKKYKAVEKPLEKKEKKEKKSKEQIDELHLETETHLVLAKETLYSISKKYGITMETICELNPELKTGNLKVGTKLKLATKTAVNVIEKELVASQSTILDTDKAGNESQYDVVHKVLSKETLYGISKKYGLTIDAIKKLNPGIENGLPVDYLLILKKGKLANDIVENSEKKAVEISKEDNETPKVIPKGNLAKGQYLIDKASEYLGSRYRSGGITSAGFDCSGLMFTTFKSLDITLPRSSHEMANYGTRIDKSQAQKGDLIFFATFGGSRVSHVGMVTDVIDDEIKFIHSSTSSGVIYSSTKERYYSRTFVQVNRVIAE